MAWLNARPSPRNKKQTNRRPPTRYDTLKASDSYKLNMPPVGEMYGMIELFNECGIVKQKAGGVEPVTLRDVADYANAVGVTLSPWQALTLRDMSTAYVLQLIKSENIDEPAPYLNDTRTEEERRQQVHDQFKRIIKSRSKK